MNPPNPPAFPVEHPLKEYRSGTSIPTDNDGMTLLDWFAGKALPEVLKDPHLTMLRVLERDEYVAVTAYQIAQAMLTERQKHLTK